MHRLLRHTLFCLAALTVTGCTEFPEIDAVVPETAKHAPYPDLLPLDTLLVEPNTVDAEAETAQVADRVSALRARAARLKRPVVPARDKSRMRRGVDRG